MDIKIRLLQQKESVKLAEMGRSTFLASFGDQNNPEDMEAYLSENFSIERIASEVSNENSTFYFAEHNSEVVGYLKINFEDAQTEDLPNALEIERIYILSNFQGKKIGQLLMDWVIQIARSKKLDTVWLGVWDQNKEAIRFYERNGFETFDTHRFMLGKDQQTDVLMRKEIDNEST